MLVGLPEFWPGFWTDECLGKFVDISIRWVKGFPPLQRQCKEDSQAYLPSFGDEWNIKS